jgi:hypothetical protein
LFSKQDCVYPMAQCAQCITPKWILQQEYPASLAVALAGECRATVGPFARLPAVCVRALHICIAAWFADGLQQYMMGGNMLSLHVCWFAGHAARQCQHIGGEDVAWKLMSSSSLVYLFVCLLACLLRVCCCECCCSFECLVCNDGLHYPVSIGFAWSRGCPLVLSAGAVVVTVGIPPQLCSSYILGCRQ